ncbi:hypothetical protein AB6806_08925 [Bosea sp. RCC_152_1]|uniref:hypothetical protein n=1 Tax=Bosea sp. RCC_152_1 TaxID=3239228 RepID=UPI003524BB6D
MRLADDDICVQIGPEHFTLRPSLRAAVRLERLAEGDFSALYQRITTGHLGTLVGVIVAASIHLTRSETVHAALRGQPLNHQLSKLALAAMALLPGITFSKPAPAGEQTEAKPIPFAQYYQRLYRIGTGIMRWSPATVWASTPAEIIEAFNGYGGTLEEELAGAPAVADTLDRNGLNKLRGKGRMR